MLACKPVLKNPGTKFQRPQWNSLLQKNPEQLCYVQKPHVFARCSNGSSVQVAKFAKMFRFAEVFNFKDRLMLKVKYSLQKKIEWKISRG